MLDPEPLDQVTKTNRNPAIPLMSSELQSRWGVALDDFTGLNQLPFLFNSGRNSGVGMVYHQPTSNPELTSKKKNQPKKNLCYQISMKNNLVFREIDLKQVLWTLCTQVTKWTNSWWVQGAWILISCRILSKTSDLPGLKVIYKREGILWHSVSFISAPLLTQCATSHQRLASSAGQLQRLRK